MSKYLWPAEWTKHRATWLAWPHNKDDWLGQIEPVHQCYIEFIKELIKAETVELICEDKSELTIILEDSGLDVSKINLHQIKTNRSWLRDSMPLMVKDNVSVKNVWLSPLFNGWAKYDNFELDQKIPKEVSKLSSKDLLYFYTINRERLVLEGGAIETNGKNTLLVTEECLLSSVQERNPGLSKSDYEALFKKFLGTEKTIWLSAGIPGDDTHGHIDDAARFVSDNAVLLAYSEKDAEFRETSKKNFDILKKSKNASNESIEIFHLPMPEPVFAEDERLPASYANFYIANESVIVPVFNDKADDFALRVIDDSFPGRNTVPIDCRALIVGCGALHCSSMQEPE